MTTSTQMNCPGEETLAAFIDGRLDEDARKRTIEHIATCAECRDVVMVARELESQERVSAAPNVIPLPAMRSKWLVPVAAVVFMAIAIGAFGPALRQKFWPSGLQRLIEATEGNSYRPIDGRIRAEFGYRPLQPTFRGSNPPSDDRAWKTVGAVAALSEQAQREPTAENVRAAGVGSLLLGDSRTAIASLERALALLNDRDPRRGESLKAAILADLSAAYSSRYREASSPLDAAAALDAAERSWRLEKTPEAAWNRAIAFEEIGARSSAEVAWMDYLQLDPSSPWSSEARQRLEKVKAKPRASWKDLRLKIEATGQRDAIEQAIILYPGQLRGYAEDELLPRWVAMTAKEQGAPRSQDLIGKAVLIARTFKERTRDVWLLDAIADLTDPKVSEQSRASFSAYCEVRSQFRAEHYSEAQELVRAQSLFRKNQDVFSLRVRGLEAFIAFYLRDFDGAARIADTLVAEANGREYPMLIAQAHWVKGLSMASERRHSDSARALTAARQGFIELGDPASAAFMGLLTAENDRMAGNLVDAWSHLMRALPDSWMLSPMKQYVCVAEAGKTAELAGFPFAALALFDSASRFARELGAPMIADASTTQALILNRLGVSGASDVLLNAERAAQQIASADVRQRVELDVAVARGAILADADPEASIAVLDEAIRSLRKQQNYTKLADALKYRAKAELRTGKRQRAMQTLENALEELRRQRLLIDDAGERALLLELARPIANEIVTLLWDEGRREEALLSVENVHAQVLLETGAMSSSPARRFDLASTLLKELPSGRTAFVEYYVLPDRVLMWVASAGRLTSRERRLTSSELERHIGALETAMKQQSQKASLEALRALYQDVIEPIEDRLRGVDAIVFVPDRILSRVPFAALPLPTGGFVVERWSSSTTPSLTWLANTRSVESISRSSAVLIVGATGSTGRLDWVSDEVQQLESLFADPVVLSDREATPQSFARHAPAASCIHYAGHAVSEGDGVSEGRLKLATGLGDLTSREIAAWRLNRAPLVTLAACESARGSDLTEGTASLARAFLAAGSPAVVAALWPVEDRYAAQFTGDLYRGLLRGENVAEAVRSAQLDAIHSATPSAPWNWSAFQVVGKGI